MKTVHPLHVLVLVVIFLAPFAPGFGCSSSATEMYNCKKMCEPRLVKEFKAEGFFSAPSCVCDLSRPEGEGQGREPGQPGQPGHPVPDGGQGR